MKSNIEKVRAALAWVGHPLVPAEMCRIVTEGRNALTEVERDLEELRSFNFNSQHAMKIDREEYALERQRNADAAAVDSEKFRELDQQLAAARALIERAAKGVRCGITRNLYGTDTRMIGSPPCSCSQCTLHAELRAFLEPPVGEVFREELGKALVPEADPRKACVPAECGCAARVALAAFADDNNWFDADEKGMPIPAWRGPNPRSPETFASVALATPCECAALRAELAAREQALTSANNSLGFLHGVIEKNNAAYRSEIASVYKKLDAEVVAGERRCAELATSKAYADAEHYRAEGLREELAAALEREREAVDLLGEARAANVLISNSESAPEWRVAGRCIADRISALVAAFDARKEGR